jgi:hypothetical protein
MCIKVIANPNTTNATALHYYSLQQLEKASSVKNSSFHFFFSDEMSAITFGDIA